MSLPLASVIMVFKLSVKYVVLNVYTWKVVTGRDPQPNEQVIHPSGLPRGLGPSSAHLHIFLFSICHFTNFSIHISGSVTACPEIGISIHVLLFVCTCSPI